MAEQSGYWSERGLGMVHVETRGSCVDLGRAWVSSAKGMVIVSSHGVILTVKKKKKQLYHSLLMHRFLKRTFVYFKSQERGSL